MVASAVTEQQPHSRRDRAQHLDSCLKGEPHTMPPPVMLLIGRCLYFATFRNKLFFKITIDYSLNPVALSLDMF